MDEQSVNLLALETSGALCSVALQLVDGRVFERQGKQLNEHASQLTLMVADILKDAGVDMRELNAIAVGAGPGSYTGLRIGYATAKGMCFGAGVPLIAVPSLAGLASGILEEVGESPADAVLLPMVDARRMEVYTQTFDTELTVLSPIEALILTERLPEKKAGQIAYYGGSGAAKATALLPQEEGWIHVAREHIYAKDLLSIGISYLLAGELEDLAYGEPQYLKEFMASRPRAGVLDGLVGHRPRLRES